MSKLTTGAAIVFMITSLLLSYMYRPGFRGGRSVMTDIPIQQPQAQPPVQQMPAVPEARPVQPETSSQAPPAPEATQKSTEVPNEQTDTKAKPPAANEQPQQGQKKTPAKSSKFSESIL